MWDIKATQAERGYRRTRSFTIPHIPYETVIRAADVDGVRAFGTENQSEVIAQVINDRLAEMRAKHAQTLEFMRAGALKGVITDGAGRTLYNLFTEYGITQKSVDFKLGTAATDVPEKIREVARHIEDNLKGELHTGFRMFVSPEFYDKLVKHKSITEKYLNSPASLELLKDNRIGFVVEPVVIEEYRASVGNVRFITAGEGIAFPMGTRETFVTYFAPADFNETVNTLGREVYAKIEPTRFDRGYELHTQSNPLPLCLRPAVLVRVYSSD